MVLKTENHQGFFADLRFLTKHRAWSPYLENSPHLWGAGPQRYHAREEQANLRGSVQELLGPKRPPEWGTCQCSIPGFACFFPVFACFFPVKAFWLCVSVVPYSPGWALCIGRSACQDAGGVASDFSLQPLLSLCPWKLEKHTGKNATWGEGARLRNQGRAAGPLLPSAASQMPGPPRRRLHLPQAGAGLKNATPWSPRPLTVSGMPYPSRSPQTSRIREVRSLVSSITCLPTATSSPQRARRSGFKSSPPPPTPDQLHE